MAVNSGLKQNGTVAKTADETKRVAVRPGRKKPWNITKSKLKMPNDVKIVEDVGSETSKLPQVAIEKSDRSNLIAADDRSPIRGPSPALTSQKNESLTVPSALPGSSDTFDDQKQLSIKRASSRLSLISSKSIDPRIRHAVVQMPPGTEEKEKDVIDPEEGWIRSAIPYLPLGQAVACLVMNIIIPGTGTMISGFFVFCGGKSRIPSKTETDVIVTLCVNIWVGVSQLFTVTFLLVGWFWSLAWGVKMVILSVEWRKQRKLERAKQLQTLALSAFSTNVGGRT